MEAVVIQELEDKFAAYEDKKAERLEALGEEIDLKNDLMEMLSQNKAKLKKDKDKNPYYLSEALMKKLVLKHGSDSLAVEKVKEETAAA